MAGLYSCCTERGTEPERQVAWLWMSAPKGRDVEDRESDEGGMARKLYRKGEIDFTEIMAGL